MNGWELLLKAKWLDLHGNKKQSLYVYEHRTTKSGQKGKRKYIKRTRSNAPFTHELGYLAKQLVNKKTLDTSACQNIDIMLEFRDCATHFYNESPTFYNRLYEVGAACLRNFANAAGEWFQRDVGEFNLHLMPMTFIALPPNVKSSLLNADESNFMASMEELDVDPESPYSVSVNVELRFTKSKSKEGFPVQVTGDPSAVPVNITEEQILARYPWDYTTLMWAPCPRAMLREGQPKSVGNATHALRRTKGIMRLGKDLKKMNVSGTCGFLTQVMPRVSRNASSTPTSWLSWTSTTTRTMWTHDRRREDSRVS